MPLPPPQMLQFAAPLYRALLSQDEVPPEVQPVQPPVYVIGGEMSDLEKKQYPSLKSWTETQCGIVPHLESGQVHLSERYASPFLRRFNPRLPAQLQHEILEKIGRGRQTQKVLQRFELGSAPDSVRGKRAWRTPRSGR